MDQKLTQAFKSIPEKIPSTKLEGLILSKIRSEEKKKMKNRLILSYFGLAGSCGAVSYAVLAFGQSILQSDFWRIASLIFSDATIISQDWKEFSLSLLENVPAINIALVLTPIFVLFLFIHLYSKLNSKNRYKYI